MERHLPGTPAGRWRCRPIILGARQRSSRQPPRASQGGHGGLADDETANAEERPVWGRTTNGLEMLTSSAGIGYLIMSCRTVLDSPQGVAAIIPVLAQAVTGVGLSVRRPTPVAA
jgi:hypothetical protein